MVSVGIPAAGMILCCMSPVRRVMGMLRVLDGVHNVIIVAGVGCIICGLAGMVSVVRSMVALSIRPLMIVFVMAMVGAQRQGDEGECGERN